MKTTQTTTTTNPETGTVTVRTVRVARIGSEVLVIKEWASTDRNGFKDFNSVIVCQGSAKRAKAYMAANDMALAIPAAA